MVPMKEEDVFLPLLSESLSWNPKVEKETVNGRDGAKGVDIYLF